YVELGAYKCHVFIDIREVQDNAWRQYADLAAYLGGRGVPSVDEALKELFLQPILQPFKELVNGETFGRLYAARIKQPDQTLDTELLDQVEQRTVALLQGIKAFAGAEGDEATVAQDIRRTLEAVLQLLVLQSRFPVDGVESEPEQIEADSRPPTTAPATEAKATVAALTDGASDPG